MTRNLFDPGAELLAADLPQDVETPCFVVLESAILDNLEATAEACGGVRRLMPHVKTHRAEWVVRLLLSHGVQAFKTATVTETAMVLEAGGRRVVWAYPTLNPRHIRSFIALARQHPDASLEGLVDSIDGWNAWNAEMGSHRPRNLRLRIDLDPGMGRTGAPIDSSATALGRALYGAGCFAGWHVYDGHIQDKQIDARRLRVKNLAAAVMDLVRSGSAQGLSESLIAGGSYSFDLWPVESVDFVSPGSWTYSSAQHDAELPHLGWKPAAFVLATVMSRHGGSVTLDAGSKAIAPDKPMSERFRWPAPIRLMSEEHAVVPDEDGALCPGDRVLLMPRHACTTAYLYDHALVRTLDGRWDRRTQLGSKR